MTGAGGPDPLDGAPPGTVCFGVDDHGVASTETQVFAGDPGEVVRQTIEHAVQLLLDHASAFEEVVSHD